MVKRPFWLNLIKQAWTSHSIIWLSGVRRSGKTTLCRSLPGAEYFDCEMPSVRREMEDVESFLEAQKGRCIVLDEIHRLSNPSELLKLAADYHKDIRIVATGSSTLGASSKFRDTLTGRKAEIWMTPMLAEEGALFGDADPKRRMRQGGLPPFFLAEQPGEKEFQAWIDSFWAKDIQELFRLERRQAFQRFTELLFLQSGGIFEATRFSKPCEVSRQTIVNYLGVLEATSVVHVLRPFSAHKPTEVVAAPKVYAFDTGFVAAFRGWKELRTEDYGILWEHMVLNEMVGRLQNRSIRYWRDKRFREVDFVITPRGKPPVAIECKWSAEGFDPKNIIAFRTLHPQGPNFVVCQNVTKAYNRRYGDLQVRFIGLSGLIKNLQE